MKFLVDMPLSPTLARWLEGLGHEAAHASEIGMAQASDAEILARVRLEGRTIVTADLDYPRLLALARAASPSLILFRGGNWSEAAVRAHMGEILGSLTNDDIASSILVIGDGRVRRRRLPIAGR